MDRPVEFSPLHIPMPFLTSLFSSPIMSKLKSGKKRIIILIRNHDSVHSGHFKLGMIFSPIHQLIILSASLTKNDLISNQFHYALQNRKLPDGLLGGCSSRTQWKVNFDNHTENSDNGPFLCFVMGKMRFFHRGHMHASFQHWRFAFDLCLSEFKTCIFSISFSRYHPSSLNIAMLPPPAESIRGANEKLMRRTQPGLLLFFFAARGEYCPPTAVDPPNTEATFNINGKLLINGCSSKTNLFFSAPRG